jgi:DNA-binding MarR family transcriptional regulator
MLEILSEASLSCFATSPADQYLVSAGLRTTQFSILSKLRRLEPMMINELAAELVMDRTTLRRNNLPLEREGLISIVRGLIDRHRHLVACGQNFVLCGNCRVPTGGTNL